MLSLHKAPQRRHGAYQQQGRGDGHKTGLSSRVLGAHRQLGAEQDHQQHGDESQRRQETQGDAEGTLGVAGIVPRQRITHHPTDCHRQARRGDRQQHIIGGKNQLIHAHARIADQPRQRDAVQRADHFAHDSDHAENRHSAYDGFLCFAQTKQPPFLSDGPVSSKVHDGRPRPQGAAFLEAPAKKTAVMPIISA